MVTAASVSEDTHYDADDLAWDAAKEVAITLMDGATAVAKLRRRRQGRRPHRHQLLRGHLAGGVRTGRGPLDGATKLGTVTAGEYTQVQGPGGR